MAAPIDIHRLVWDDWNGAHIRDRHGVARIDVEFVLRSDFSIARATYKERILVLGPAATGQVLAVVVGENPDEPGAFYTYSARPASRKERRYFEEQKEIVRDGY